MAGNVLGKISDFPALSHIYKYTRGTLSRTADSFTKENVLEGMTHFVLCRIPQCSPEKVFKPINNQSPYFNTIKMFKCNTKLQIRSVTGNKYCLSLTD